MNSSVFDLSYMGNKIGLAARTGDYVYLIQAFKQTSANYNLVASTDNCGWNALHEAAAAGNHKCLDIILQYLNTLDDLEEKRFLISRTTFAGFTPLILAVIHNHLECVRILLDHGSSVNDTTSDHSTALHFICSASVCSALLDAGAEINHKNNFDVTPLLNCLSRTDKSNCLHSLELLKITRLLLDCGADPFCSTNGCDSAVMATLFCSSSVLNCLLCDEKERKGAAFVAEHINKQLCLTYQLPGTTMLSCAILHACDCTNSPEKEDSVESLNLLFEFGAIFSDDVQCSCIIQPHVWLVLLFWGVKHTEDVLLSNSNNDFCLTVKGYLRQNVDNNYMEDGFAQLLGLISAGTSGGASISSWLKFETVKELLHEDFDKERRIDYNIAACWLKKRIGQPRSLQHLARLKLRRTLAHSGAVRGNAQLSKLCLRLHFSQPATDLVLLHDASEALRLHQPDFHIW